MKKDRMSSPERMQAIIAGEKPDRVPCIPFISGHCAVICGQPIAKIYDDAQTSFTCQVRSQEMYGYDGGPVYCYAAAGGWEFGGDIEFPYKKYSGAPVVTRNPVQTEEDALNLTLPDDITKAGAVPIELEFARLQAKHGMPITVQVGAPLTWAGSVIGEERMLVWMIKKPELVHAVLRQVSAFVLRVAEYWANEFGAENLMVFEGCATESNRLISPKQFETFVFPYLQEVHQKITDLGVGQFFSHICGEQNANLKYWQQLPFGKRGILSFGTEVPLKKVSELFPQHIITGNVDPTVIQEGTADEVLALAKQCIEDGKNHPGGYILMSGCDIPPGAPPVNVYQLIKACREYGQY